MAVVGFVRQEQYEVKAKNENEENKVYKWLECYFRVAGIRPFQAKLVENKNKQNDRSPDYYIYLRGNTNKGDTFRDMKIGSLWQKQKVDENSNTVKYLTGQVEIAFKNVNILIQRPTKFYEEEQIGFLYEIIAFNDDKQQQKQDMPINYYGYENETNIDIPDEEIPF